MGKTVGGHPQAPAVTPSANAGGREPIGRYLAQQRKLRGLSLDELSTQTRIPRRSLERLEAGAFDRTPDGFARGFVRTVAEAIGLDPDETVARMLAEPTHAARSLPRAGGALFALIGAALVALLAYAASNLDFGSASEPAVAEPAGGLPVRRDYVRELAEAHGLAPAEATDATLPAEPPTPEAPASELSAPELAREASEPPATSSAPLRAATPAAAAPVPVSSIPAARPPPEAAAEAPLALPAAAVVEAAEVPEPTQAAVATEAAAAEPAPPAPTAAPEPFAGGAPLDAGIPAPAEATPESAPTADAAASAPAAASERDQDPD